MRRRVSITDETGLIKGLIPVEPYEGETIETKVHRMTQNKEPIKDAAPLVYTEKKKGVLPQYNIRTDKWDLVLDKMEAANRQKLAKAKGLELPKSETTEKTDTPTETSKNAPST